MKDDLRTSEEIAQQIVDGIELPDYRELLQLAKDYRRLENVLRTCGSHISWAFKEASSK